MLAGGVIPDKMFVRLRLAIGSNRFTDFSFPDDTKIGRVEIIL